MPAEYFKGVGDFHHLIGSISCTPIWSVLSVKHLSIL
jgi:hypothetical protein